MLDEIKHCFQEQKDDHQPIKTHTTLMPSHNPQTNLSKRDGDLRQQIGKTPICAGQSDLERLELRKSYRILRGDIVEESRAEEDNYPEWRQRHNHLWDQVRYPREAVCDAGIFEVLTGHVTQQIDGMIEVREKVEIIIVKKFVF